VCVGVCLYMWCLFVLEHLFPAFLLINTMIRSFPTCSRKKERLGVLEGNGERRSPIHCSGVAVEVSSSGDGFTMANPGMEPKRLWIWERG
jgi:hypothetical protein